MQCVLDNIHNRFVVDIHLLVMILLSEYDIRLCNMISDYKYDNILFSSRYQRLVYDISYVYGNYLVV